MSFSCLLLEVLVLSDWTLISTVSVPQEVEEEGLIITAVGVNQDSDDEEGFAELLMEDGRIRVISEELLGPMEELLLHGPVKMEVTVKGSIITALQVIKN